MDFQALYRIAQPEMKIDSDPIGLDTLIQPMDNHYAGCLDSIFPKFKFYNPIQNPHEQL